MARAGGFSCTEGRGCGTTDRRAAPSRTTMNLYDIGYGLGVGVTAPYWLIRPRARRKVFRAFKERMGRVAPPEGDNRGVLIHAASLGGRSATRPLVAILPRERSDRPFAITTTTATAAYPA